MMKNEEENVDKRMANWILSDEDYLPEPPIDFISLTPPPDDGAPHPLDAGLPDYGYGEYFPSDEDAEALPAVLDAVEMRKVEPALIEASAKLDQNDHGNAKRLLLHFERELLNVREIGWHRFLGTHWEPNGGRENAIDLAQRVAQRIALEADYMTATPVELQAIEKGEQAKRDLKALRRKALKDWTADDKTRAEILDAQIIARKLAIDALKKRQINRRKFAVSSGNMSRSLSMLSAAEPHRTVPSEALDTDPLAFNCRNGTLRFVRQPDPDSGSDVPRDKWTVELQPHNCDDMIAKCAPVDYVRDAESPRFKEFIERFQPIEAVRKFVQTYHGYALTGQTGEQCLLFNIGGGSNGKSTFLEVVCRIMGPYAQTLQFASIAEIGFGRRGDQATPDIARLPGARLVRASEPKRGERFDEAMIKSMTGGEPMLVRHLQKGFFEFRPVFKLALSGNHRPEISGVDHGIWRRMRIVPWPVTMSDAEKRPIDEVLAEFEQEYSGILNWLIAGALDYLNNGLQAPKEVTAATDDYREDMDPIGAFIRDCVTVHPPAPNGRSKHSVSAREMYTAFCAHCLVNSVRPWKEKAFAAGMQQKGFVKDRTMTVRRYVNVSLYDVPAAQPTHVDQPLPATEEDYAP